MKGLVPGTSMTFPRRRRRPNPLPGFGISVGYTTMVLTLLVLVPLSTIVIKTASMGWLDFWHAISNKRALASYGLSFGGALAAALVNCLFGTVVAWVLVRYRFFGKRFFDAMVDLPFAVPTAVAGIALTVVWGPEGVFGGPLGWLGVKGAYSRLGVIIAMVFVGLPFVVRTVQPMMEALDREVEEAAKTLGATDMRIFFRVLLPGFAPGLITGFALSFARALGEYGSVVFISGNMPMRTEIAPLLIMTKLEQFDYTGATAIAVVMLTASFSILFIVNGFMWRRRPLSGGAG